MADPAVEAFGTGAGPDPALVARDDVALYRMAGRMYVCRSDGPAMRLRAQDPGPDGPVAPAELDAGTAAALAERGLLVPAAARLRRHPGYPAEPPPGTGVRLLGGGALAGSLAGSLAAAGVPVGTAHRPAVLAVGLDAADAELAEAAGAALDGDLPVLAYLGAGSRVYWAVLRPPVTACPLCLATRIRAGGPPRALAGLGLGVVLGTVAGGTRWPATEAAAALLAHQATRLLTGATSATGTSGATSAPGSSTTVPDGGELAAADVGELLELDLDTAATARHPLLHTPRCPACHDRARPPDGPAPRDTAQSWARMSRGVDPLTGIVAGLVVIPPGDPRGGVDCTVAWARGGTDTTWFSAVRASTVGGATKQDPELARVCAMGEVLERYAAGIHRPEDFVRGSLAELGPDAVDPRSLPLGSAREYAAIGDELAPYRPDLVIDWVRGHCLTSGRPRLLPAAAVYVPYRAPDRGERLLHPNSTGLAAGADRAHATFAGLCEVVERDAAAVYWYNRLVTPTLDLGSLPDGPARAVLDRIAARGVRLLAKDITTDLGIPAVLLRARFADGPTPVALCSFRADLSLADCLLGAAQELEHLLAMYRRARDDGRVTDPAGPPRDIWDFATYYCHDSRIGKLDFMAEGPVRAVPGPPDAAAGHAQDTSSGHAEAAAGHAQDTASGHAAAVTELVGRLARAGHEVVTVDLTPIDVAECGVAVVRSVVPGLQPVSFHPTFRQLGGPRVYAAPVRMGLRGRPLTELELNADPVPLG
jgi:thiazole/oxazole-forming peptide maturase SagD family component